MKSTKITPVYDFTITNKTSFNLAIWTWQLTQTKEASSDIFKVNRLKGTTVKPLPTLATANLQPVTDTVWIVPNTFKEIVHVQILFSVSYLRATVLKHSILGNRFLYNVQLFEELKLFGKNISIDYSSVTTN